MRYAVCGMRYAVCGMRYAVCGKLGAYTNKPKVYVSQNRQNLSFIANTAQPLPHTKNEAWTYLFNLLLISFSSNRISFKTDSFSCASVFLYGSFIF